MSQLERFKANVEVVYGRTLLIFSSTYLFINTRTIRLWKLLHLSLYELAKYKQSRLSIEAVTSGDRNSYSVQRDHCMPGNIMLELVTLSTPSLTNKIRQAAYNIFIPKLLYNHYDMFVFLATVSGPCAG